MGKRDLRCAAKREGKVWIVAVLLILLVLAVERFLA
jgi:hypothetical protein